MTDAEKMQTIDAQFSHIWMVRTFLKHSEEATVDEELREIHRDLYDVMHAFGAAYTSDDAAAYLKQARKKLGKLRRTAKLFTEIQPEVSGHTNFVMAARSLENAVQIIDATLAD